MQGRKQEPGEIVDPSPAEIKGAKTRSAETAMYPSHSQAAEQNGSSSITDANKDGPIDANEQYQIDAPSGGGGTSPLMSQLRRNA